jgi:hypothetical protein
VTEPEIDPLLKVIKEVNALADHLDLFRIVELQAEGAGRYGGGQGGECRAFLEDDRLEAGALGKVRGGAADDAPSDDDEVGGFGR